MAKASRSIRRQLLLMTLVALIVINGVVVWTANLYANRAARLSYDRLLLGLALQIAENINILDGEVVIDLPRSAFETLAMAPLDRVFVTMPGSLLIGSALNIVLAIVLATISMSIGFSG